MGWHRRRSLTWPSSELGADRVAPQLIHRPVPRLTYRDVVVAAPPCGDPEAYTSLLDLALAAGATVVASPLAQITAAIGVYKGTAAIVPRGTDVPGPARGAGPGRRLEFSERPRPQRRSTKVSALVALIPLVPQITCV